MTTTVAYHADGYSAARPAVNVKLYCAGLDMRSALVDRAMPDQADAIHELAYERVVSDFWQAAEELSVMFGCGAITQEGRSGGWLVLTDAPDLEGADKLTRDERAWLLGYDRLRRWAENEVGMAPDRVARLAQDIAMDELGARAVARMG